ncbi:unnamed protein product, partial [marine sediment metagenome]
MSENARTVPISLTVKIDVNVLQCEIVVINAA